MNQLTLELQPVEPSYRLIPLSRGQFAIVDAEDFDWLNQWKWSAHFHSRRKVFEAARSYWEGGKCHHVSMSRLIKNAPSGVVVDHENHNTLDNRRFNLRLASNRQNGWNRGVPINNTSGFKGVSLERRKGRSDRWVAQININGKNTRLGRFKTKEAAFEAYKASANNIHGEFVYAGYSTASTAPAPASVGTPLADRMPLSDRR